MTPSLARMVLALGGKVMLPLKWFSIPQCWRYENVQRGRKREHYQWNMDIFGEKSVSAELELLAAVVAFFERVGITSNDVGLRVNSRAVLGAVLESHAVAPEQFAPVCVIVDKLDKIGEDAVVAELAAAGVGEAAGRQIVKTLAIKSFDELRALLPDGAANRAIDELSTLFDLAAAYGIGAWLTFDASVVRGLAYYTGVVFEGFDRSGELRAICGGGRYDRLLSLYGAPTEVPACGFGFGDCVLMELLALKGKLPKLPQHAQFVVVPFDEAMRAPALKVAASLRAGGYSVDVLLEPTKKVPARARRPRARAGRAPRLARSRAPAASCLTSSCALGRDR
jgi:histidyl-tRNA synthetase